MMRADGLASTLRELTNLVSRWQSGKRRGCFLQPFPRLWQMLC